MFYGNFFNFMEIKKCAFQQMFVDFMKSTKIICETLFFNFHKMKKEISWKYGKGTTDSILISQPSNLSYIQKQKIIM